MRSPDGNIEVVRKKNFSKSEKLWCGWIEIPSRRFLLRGRKFMDPMVFSPNSRFLALIEFTCTAHQSCRVVVLDFLTGKQFMAHDERSERLQDSPHVTSLRWADDSTLRIGTVEIGFSDGRLIDIRKRILTWKAP